MLVGQRRLWWRYMIRAHVRLREYRQLFGYSRCCKVGWNSLADVLTALRCISFVCSYTLKGQQSNLTILKTACCVWSIFSFMLSSLQGMISSCFGVTLSMLHIFMWTRSLLRLRKQIRIGFFSESSYVQLCCFREMAHSYCPVLFCLVASMSWE